MKTKQKLVAVLASAAAIAGGGILAAPGASASGYGCSGTEVGTYAEHQSTDNAVIMGYAHLYYDSSTGYNCAVNVSTADGGYGTPHDIQVYLRECTQTSPSSTCTETGPTGYDEKNTYAYYAGPVKVKAPGHCIRLYATTTYDFRFADFSSGAFHCG